MAGRPPIIRGETEPYVAGAGIPWWLRRRERVALAHQLGEARRELHRYEGLTAEQGKVIRTLGDTVTDLRRGLAAALERQRELQDELGEVVAARQRAEGRAG